MPFFFKHDGVAYSVLHHKHTIYIAGGNLMVSTWVILRIINFFFFAVTEQKEAAALSGRGRFMRIYVMWITSQALWWWCCPDGGSRSGRRWAR